MAVFQHAGGETGTLTVLGDVIGTPGYMAPEQSEGRIDEQDTSTDIFNLGATLAHIIYGSSPITIKKTDAKKPLRVNATDIAPQRWVPRDLWYICRKAMGEHVDDRYKSVRALKDDVERFFDDEEIAAKRDSLLQRFSRWSRHHTALITNTSIVVLLSAVFFSIAVAATFYYKQELAASKQREWESEMKLADMVVENEYAWETFDNATGKMFELIQQKPFQLREKDLDATRLLLHQMEIDFAENQLTQADVLEAYLKLGHEFEQFFAVEKASDCYQDAINVALKELDSTELSESHERRVRAGKQKAEERYFACSSVAKTVEDLEYPTSLANCTNVEKSAIWREATKAFVVRAQFQNAIACINKIRSIAGDDYECWYIVAQAYGFFSRLPLGFDFTQIKQNDRMRIILFVQKAEKLSIESLDVAIDKGFDDGNRIGQDSHFHGLFGRKEFTDRLTELWSELK